MKSIKYLLFILVFVGSQSTQAQYIISNATIYSVDSSSNTYEAMAVMNGKILALGMTEDLKKQYPTYEVKDMKGKFVYPGFIDAHCHFLGLGLSMQMVDLRNTKSLAEVIQKCVEYDKKNPSNILFGRGWDQNDWTDKNFPDNEQLSKLFPNKIVILKRIDGHAALCNDFVLQKAGITDKKMVEGGEVIMKNNKPSGVLIDNAVD
ncbi:MAG: amidohydrolase family protein, partial [Bacteroidetes bacterium]|nr:amidohydrolase family protein [Bacteroidota bacterium]